MRNDPILTPRDTLTGTLPAAITLWVHATNWSLIAAATMVALFVIFLGDPIAGHHQGDRDA